MTKRALILSFILLLGFLGQSIAGKYYGPNRDDKGNIVPTPKGEACIAPIDEMRRTHMSMLLHKRDQTMHEGIRSKHASLTECINCHVTPDAKGDVARIESDKHFCASCHIAASVTIDCFECHADRPATLFDQAKTQ